MPAPALTITGTLQDVFGVADANSSLVVQLCNFGSQVPRVSGTSLLANTAPMNIDCPVGTFSFPLYGNDVITPAGTYYTIQVQDDNGNIVQTNAYILNGAGARDLSTIVPFVPNYVPAVIPAPQPGSLNVVLAFSATPIFNCLNTAGIIAFDMTLTGNVTSSTIINTTPGQLVTFCLQQDGTGGRTFAWPGNVYGAGVPDATPGAISTQTFYVRANGNLYDIGPMSIN